MKNLRTIFLNRILALMLTIVALMTGQEAWAESNWSVTNPTGSTFRITRPDSHVGTTETVKYRTVNLSAYAGQHYTAVNSEVTFGSEDTYKEVTVTERTPSHDVYKYQNGDSRKYRFDVTDLGGFNLAYCDREITTGTSVPSSGMFSIKDVTIQTSEYPADDRGYDNNGYKYVAASSYCTSGTQAYLRFLNAQLRMTLSFDAKENDDAYEYLQILFDNTSTCDGRSSAKDGNPGTPNLSRYMAGFEMNTGSKDDTYRNYTFPVTSAGDNASATNPWGHGDKWPLKNQKFKNGYRATDGRLIVPTDFSTLVLRLNASGSSGSDQWAAKNVIAHIQAVDDTKPTVVAYSVASGRHSKGNTVYVSVVFNEIVRVAGTATLTTDNNWGDFNYVAGSGTNVLTFSRNIPADASGNLNITGLSGTVNDLAGNSLTGSSVTATNLCSLDASYAYTITYDLDEGVLPDGYPATYTWETATFTLNNPTKTGYYFDGWMGSNGSTPETTVTIANHSHGNKSYTANWTKVWTGSGTQGDPYTITSPHGLDLLAQYVNSGNTCKGLYFQLGGNIEYTYKKAWNEDGTQNNYTRIGNAGVGFEGTFDGQNYTISGIRMYKGGSNTNDDSGLGLFGGVMNGGKVKRVNLSNTRITGFYRVAGIAATTYNATIEDCTVAADVCIHAVKSSAYYHGGIVGYNQSPINRCISRATLTVANSSGCHDFGGIAGYNSNKITDCIADGVIIPDVKGRGAIVGYHIGTLTRNYYRGCNVAGTENATGVGKGNSDSTTETSDVNGAQPLYAVTLPANASLTREPSATLPRSGNKTYTTGADINGASYAVASSNLLISYNSASIPSGYVLGSISANQTTNGEAVAVTDNGNYTYNYTMPAADVTVTATLLPIVSYIDADGNAQSHACTPIVSGTTSYGNSENTVAWYYVDGTVNYSSDATLTFNDQHVNIILCDGAMLKNGNGFVTNNFINVVNGSLAIYGQSGGTGSIVCNKATRCIEVKNNIDFNGGNVSATTSSNQGIYSTYGSITIRRGSVTASGSNYAIMSYSGDIIIHGGTVNAESQCNAIYAKNNLTINGGTVTANATYTTESYYSGLRTNSGDVSILGGNVTATGQAGIIAGYTTSSNYGKRTITLGCATLADCITASSYACSTLTIADGQILSDGTDAYSGTLSSEQKTAIAGKTLSTTIPYVDADGTTKYKGSHDLTFITTSTSGTINYGDAANAEGWYCVNSDVDFDEKEISFNDQQVNIILCDGSTMSAKKTTQRPFKVNNGSLAIYGQTLGTGTLTVYSRDGHAIYAKGNIDFNGGTINSTSGYDIGILADNNITIRRGKIMAKGGSRNDFYGFKAGGTITLGCATTADRIYSTGYNGTVSIAEGQTLTDGNSANTYANTLTDEQKNAIKKKTMMKALGDVSYIDENGKEQICNNYKILSDGILTATLHSIGESSKDTWYVASGSYTYNATYLQTDGHVHIILCDGANFTVNGSGSYGIHATGNLTIYGQSQGTGTLTVNVANTSGKALYVDYGNLVVNGGVVSAHGGEYGIYINNGNLTVNGGSINCSDNKGLYVNGDALMGSPLLAHHMPQYDIKGLLSVKLTMNSIGIMTYSGVNSLDFTNVSGLSAYVALSDADDNGNITLTRTYKPAGMTGMVLCGEPSTSYIVPAVKDKAPDVYQNNLLRHVIVATEIDKSDGYYTNYILAKKNGNVGFYPLSGKGTLKPYSAYLQLHKDDTMSRGLVLNFEEEGTPTGVGHTEITESTEMADAIYDLQGRRIEKPKKGLYIVNGRKVMIK